MQAAPAPPPPPPQMNGIGGPPPAPAGMPPPPAHMPPPPPAFYQPGMPTSGPPQGSMPPPWAQQPGQMPPRPPYPGAQLLLLLNCRPCASHCCVQLLLCLCPTYEAACRCTSTMAAATAAVGRATWHAAPRIRRSPARDAASARVPRAPARVEAPRHATAAPAAAAMTCSYTSFLSGFDGLRESRGQQAVGMANCLGYCCPG